MDFKLVSGVYLQKWNDTIFVMYQKGKMEQSSWTEGVLFITTLGKYLCYHLLLQVIDIF